MDEKTIRQVQQEAAEALLNVGVSLPLKEFRLPFRKRPIILRVTMRRPCMSGQIEIARTYLSMGVTAEQMAAFNSEEQMRFIADHGAKICHMIACAICVGPIRRRFLRPVSWFIRNCVEHRYQIGAIHRFVSLMGTDPFTNIIRLAERTNPMKPRLSRKAKMS